MVGLPVVEVTKTEIVDPPVIEENGIFFKFKIYLRECKLTTGYLCSYLDDADDFEDEVVEPEPEPEHSSLANMLNNDEEDEYGYGYDEEY